MGGFGSRGNLALSLASNYSRCRGRALLLTINLIGPLRPLSLHLDLRVLLAKSQPTEARVQGLVRFQRRVLTSSPEKGVHLDI